MSVRSLAKSIRAIVNQKIANEARAKRGTMQNGMFVSGFNSFPCAQAVDCNVNDGNRVWAQISKNGTAVIVGA